MTSKQFRTNQVLLLYFKGLSLALAHASMLFNTTSLSYCMDGTFLTGISKGHMLTAIRVDGNNQLLPVSFAFMESENTDSWCIGS
jgi:hypothetical protein